MRKMSMLMPNSVGMSITSRRKMYLPIQQNSRSADDCARTPPGDVYLGRGRLTEAEV